MALLRLNGDHVLVVFSTNFQLRDRARIVALTLEFFGTLVRIVPVAELSSSIAPVLASVALDHLAIFLQALAVIGNNLAGLVVRIVFRNHQLHAKGFGENAEIEGVAVLFVVMRPRARVEWKTGLSRVRIIAQVQVSDRTVYVEALVLVSVRFLRLSA